MKVLIRQMNILLEIGELIVVQPSSTGWDGFGRPCKNRHSIYSGSRTFCRHDIMKIERRNSVWSCLWSGQVIAIRIWMCTALWDYPWGRFVVSAKSVPLSLDVWRCNCVRRAVLVWGYKHWKKSVQWRLQPLQYWSQFWAVLLPIRVRVIIWCSVTCAFSGRHDVMSQKPRMLWTSCQRCLG